MSATYILEVKDSSGHVVWRRTADYHQSAAIEETVTLEASDNYTVNVTVFVPSYAALGSHTNITKIGEPIEHIITNSTTIILFIQTPTFPLHLLMKVNKSTSLTSILLYYITPLLYYYYHSDTYTPTSPPNEGKQTLTSILLFIDRC